MEEVTGETTPHCFSASVVFYMRPDNVATKEKAEIAESAQMGL